MNFNFKKENFNVSNVKNVIFGFFLNHSELIFMLFFVGMTFYSGFLVYRYIYTSVWSQEQKDAYLKELKKDEVNFKIDEFNAVVDRIKKRQEIYNTEVVLDVRDIFGIKK
jgi:hypothetical protein